MILAVIILAVLALIPAYIASKKGRDFAEWYFLGFILWPIILFVSIFMSDNRPVCPYCQNHINNGSTVCQYCGKEVDFAFKRGEMHEAVQTPQPKKETTVTTSASFEVATKVGRAVSAPSIKAVIIAAVVIILLVIFTVFR